MTQHRLREIWIVTDVFDLIGFSQWLYKIKRDHHSAGAANRENVALLKNCLVSRSMCSMSYAVDPSAFNVCSRELHLSGSLRGLVQRKDGRLFKKWPKSGVAPSCAPRDQPWGRHLLRLSCVSYKAAALCGFKAAIELSAVHLFFTASRWAGTRCTGVVHSEQLGVSVIAVAMLSSRVVGSSPFWRVRENTQLPGASVSQST